MSLSAAAVSPPSRPSLDSARFRSARLDRDARSRSCAPTHRFLSLYLCAFLQLDIPPRPLFLDDVERPSFVFFGTAERRIVHIYRRTSKVRFNWSQLISMYNRDELAFVTREFKTTVFLFFFPNSILVLDRNGDALMNLLATMRIWNNK